MPDLEIITDPEFVDEYLVTNDLLEGFSELRAVLLQVHGMNSGMPAVMFVIEVDGKLVLAKTSYRLFMASVGSIQGTLQRLSDEAAAAVTKATGN